MSLKHTATVTCLLGALVLSPTGAFANQTVSTTAKPDSQSQSETEEKRKTLMADATSAIEETQAALKQLDDGKTQGALAALERASGKLDIILTRDPKLELAPAGVSVTTYDIQGGIDAVKRVRQQAEGMIDLGRSQEARRLLRDLASETVISVRSIPLATYPDTIKSAVKLIDQHKLDAAKRVLQTALNTQVVTETIVPLPIVQVGANFMLESRARMTSSLPEARSNAASASFFLPASSSAKALCVSVSAVVASAIKVLRFSSVCSCV